MLHGQPSEPLCPSLDQDLLLKSQTMKTLTMTLGLKIHLKSALLMPTLVRNLLFLRHLIGIKEGEKLG